MQVLIFIPLGFLLFLTEGLSATAKEGLSVGPNAYICGDTFAFTGATWWYDWGYNQSEHHIQNCSTTTRGEYVPMIWGEKALKTVLLPKTGKYVLGFNEPDRPDQSNMTPQKVAELWPQVELKAKGKILIGPALSGCGDANHCIGWLTEFFNYCKYCRVDLLAAHAYSCDADGIISSLEAISAKFQKKIWLTEFSCAKAKTVAEQLTFLKQIQPMLESSAAVERYSWFVTRLAKNTDFINNSTDLLEWGSSTLTELGQAYDGYQP